MNSLTLILESLWHHRRAHAGAFLGAAVAVAAIVGALGAGDSVRASLDRLALARIGRTEYALAAEDRFFRSHLAEEMAGHVDAEVVTALRLPGVASTPAGARAGGIQVLGVEPRFWFLGREFAPFSSPTPGEAIVNRKLADRLSLKPGDEFLLHVGRPDAVPSETPLAAAGGETAGLRVVVRAVAREAQLGDFGLRPNQAAPSNAFVSLPWLAEQAGIPGRANVLLVAGRRGKPPPLDDLQGILRDAWTLEDAGLELREAGRRTLELRSSRIFLDAAAEEAALDAGHGARGVFAYFVNSIRCGQRETPYSFAAAPGEPIVPRGMDDAEILLTDWLADDLGAVPGDMVELRYFVPGPMRRLEERASSFRVRDIVPPSGPAAERDLVPDIPGLAGSETCSAWKPGFPIDLGRVRPKDEAYWKERRTAPKAFVTLAAAREMWANRFGRLTSVRYAADASLRDKIAALVLKGAPPSSMGIVLRPVRQEALRAGRGSTEFGSLFAGLSGFLVAAALLLAGLLFALGIEARAEETGTLLALGFPPGRVRRLRLVEGGIVALLGGVAGALLGVLYIRLLLLGLGTFWIGAIGTSSLVARVERLSLYGGAAAGTAAAFLAMAVAAFLQAARRPRELQAGAESVPEFSAVRLALRILAGAAAAAGAVAIVAAVGPGRGREAAPAFFGAGVLALVAGLLLCDTLLLALGRSGDAGAPGMARLGLRNAWRRRGRSLAAAGALACGVFLVAAVGANRIGPEAGAGRASGTGGFALYGELPVPLGHDLNSPEGRKALALDLSGAPGARFLGIRVREGDDASCLNLNRVERPRLLGADPRAFTERGAFRFEKVLLDTVGRDPWTQIEADFGPDVVPGAADWSVVSWGLGLRLGDTIQYTDERGKPFAVKLVAGLSDSVFQGSVLVSEANFLRKFPSSGGARVFLVDASPEEAAVVERALDKALGDAGLAIGPARERLATFMAVQNTYLSIFLALGAVGLLIGSAGLGVVVFRNVMERRAELAMLRAVGFSRRALQGLLLWEHGFLLVLGLAVGTLAAAVAVLPALLTPGAPIPWSSLGLTLGAVAASGLAWVALATHLATRGPLLDALRSE